MHFPFRLLEDMVMGWMGETILIYWQPVVGIFITWVFPFIIVFGAIWFGYSLRKPRYIQEKIIEETIIQVLDRYEEHIKGGGGECGLTIRNMSRNPLTNCSARLIDMAFEKPHQQWSLDSYRKSEALLCSREIPQFSNGKVLIFRWGIGAIDKELFIVYQNEATKIPCGILNIPILVHLNIWADNIPATSVICKLADRLGWGYDLTILESVLQKENIKLSSFQLSNSDIEGYQTE